MPKIFDGSTSKAKQQVHGQTARPHTPAQSPSHPANHRGVRPHRYVDEYSEILRVEKPCTRAIASYSPKPVNVYLDIQAKNEHILLLLRRHPVTQLHWVLTTVGLALLPFLIINAHLFEFLDIRYQTAILIGWYLALIGYMLQSFLKWFFHVYIITDERIIDVEFTSILYKDVSAAKIENIEDITTVASGVMSSIFNYGTIIVQTAAAEQEFSFEDVPQPSKVTTLLNELIMEEEREEIEGRVS